MYVNDPDEIRKISDDSEFPKIPAFYEPLSHLIGKGLITSTGKYWEKQKASVSILISHS